MNIADEISMYRMHCLTGLGRTMLPTGFWGESSDTIGSANHLGGKNLFLTFDDGPNPHTTTQLLEVLAEENVQASFFVIGSEVEKYPDLVAQIAQGGHTLGNHSFNHNFLPGLPTKIIENEIHRTNSLIEDISGIRTKFFRPPYGIIDHRGAFFLKEAAMTIVYWGCVPEDWRQVGSSAVTKRVLRKLEAGTLIVLHEGSEIADQTIESTRAIIHSAKAQGYTFKTLAEASSPMFNQILPESF
jgi:peptidoglycan-N-acetylglucosamine deacetylase